MQVNHFSIVIHEMDEGCILCTVSKNETTTFSTHDVELAKMNTHATGLNGRFMNYHLRQMLKCHYDQTYERVTV